MHENSNAGKERKKVRGIQPYSWRHDHDGSGDPSPWYQSADSKSSPLRSLSSNGVVSFARDLQHKG